MQFVFSAFGWTPFGPDLNDPTEVGFQKEEMEAALQWLVENIKPITTGNNNHDSGKKKADFEDGELPFILGGPWDVEGFKNAEVDFGAMTIPTIKINGEDGMPHLCGSADACGLQIHQEPRCRD